MDMTPETLKERLGYLSNVYGYHKSEVTRGSRVGKDREKAEQQMESALGDLIENCAQALIEASDRESTMKIIEQAVIKHYPVIFNIEEAEKIREELRIRVQDMTQGK